MNMVKKYVGKTALWILGWRVEAHDLPTKKAILVGYPHTSTWDFPIFVFTMWALGIQTKWLGKQSLFEGSMGPLFRRLGGVPVDRSGGKNMVQVVSQLFKEHEDLLFGIAPSGTRSYSSHWRSGFYHMAVAANVPLALGSVDFGRRVGCFLGSVHLTGDMRADMDQIRSMYAHVRGRNPDRQTPIRLADEIEE